MIHARLEFGALFRIGRAVHAVRNQQHADPDGGGYITRNNVRRIVNPQINSRKSNSDD